MIGVLVAVYAGSGLFVVQEGQTGVVLQLGKIVQDGPPDLLMRGEGLYRQLVEREMDRLAQQAA